MKSGPLLHVVLSLCCAAILSCSGGLPSEFPAPDFAIKDVFTGKDIVLSAYKGRPVILYFFASW